jgi:protein-tyrosine-phosphatase
VGQEDALKTVLMVCHSNECRSPIAAAVFNEIAKNKGLDTRWYSESAGIGPTASRVNNDSQAFMRTHGIELKNMTQKVNLTDFDKFDFMLGMDEYSVEYLEYLKYLLGFHQPPKGNKTRIELLTSYDPEGKQHIAKVSKKCTHSEYWYQLSYRSCNAFLDKFS